jgi:hypothetical protein
MKKTILLSVLLMAIRTVHAQTAEDSVKNVVNQLFTGMKTGDANLIRASFSDSAILQTIANTREGRVVVRNQQMAAFAESVAKLPKGAADERIKFETVKVDGAMAIAWTPYQFYYNGNFSHCGVNMFQLVRLDGQWKINFLIDTRRKENCQ